MSGTPVDWAPMFDEEHHHTRADLERLRDVLAGHRVDAQLISDAYEGKRMPPDVAAGFNAAVELVQGTQRAIADLLPPAAGYRVPLPLDALTGLI